MPPEAMYLPFGDHATDCTAVLCCVYVKICSPVRLFEISTLWLIEASLLLYARNVTNLLQHLTSGGELKLDFEDEITRGCCVTHAGQVVNERARQLMGAPTAPQATQSEAG